jgi:hypothetical protein
LEEFDDVGGAAKFRSPFKVDADRQPVVNGFEARTKIWKGGRNKGDRDGFPWVELHKAGVTNGPWDFAVA